MRRRLYTLGLMILLLVIGIVVVLSGGHQHLFSAHLLTCIEVTTVGLAMYSFWPFLVL